MWCPARDPPSLCPRGPAGAGGRAMGGKVMRACNHERQQTKGTHAAAATGLPGPSCIADARGSHAHEERSRRASGTGGVRALPVRGIPHAQRAAEGPLNATHPTPHTLDPQQARKPHRPARRAPTWRAGYRPACPHHHHTRTRAHACTCTPQTPHPKPTLSRWLPSLAMSG